MRVRCLALCAGILLLSMPALAEPLPFSFQPPGFLLPKTGNGLADSTIHAPNIRFPLEEAPAFLNSQVYRPGGYLQKKSKFGPRGDGDFGDPRNFSYPWEDNFCELREWSVPECPSGAGHQGQDIRPKTNEKNKHWVVAVVDGKIVDIGQISVSLQGAGGRLYRYLHMEPSSITVEIGDQVTKGQRLGKVSNYLPPDGTSIHLHFDLKINSEKHGFTYVSPYMSLVTAYQRLIGEDTSSSPPADGTASNTSTGSSPTGSTGPSPTGSTDSASNTSTSTASNTSTGSSPTGPTGSSPAGSTGSSSQDPSQADIARIAKIVGKGRYMERAQCQAGQSPATSKCCQTVAENDPLLSTVLAPYKDFRLAGNGHLGLRDCRYDATNTQTQVTLETRVIMLNPTPEQVALWTISACRKAMARSLDVCAQWAWDSIFVNSGTQFAVTGPVIEPNVTNCRSDDVQPSDVGYTFRDGVTVKLKNVNGVCDGDGFRLASEPSIYFTAEAVRSTPRAPSRITIMTRQSYQSYFGGDLPARDPGPDGSIPWLKLVRDTHMQSLGAPSHPWLDKIIAGALPASARSQ